MNVLIVLEDANGRTHLGVPNDVILQVLLQLGPVLGIVEEVLLFLGQGGHGPVSGPEHGDRLVDVVVY